MTPELIAIRQAIEDQITTNHNGEITGAILNPILVGMITALVDSIGDIEQLDTTDKENTVRAINELNALIQDLEPIQKFTGEDNPNDNPPTGAKLGDLYFQMDGGNVIDVWQFIEIRWVSLDTSSFVRKSGENLVSSDFSLKNKVGSAESSINLEGIVFKVTSKDVDENWNATLSFSAEEGLYLTFADGGRYVVIYDYEIRGNNFRLAFPNIGNNRHFIPVSVNNQFADEFGNIEIESTDTNALKKNESNLVTNDFEITNIENGYGSSVTLDGYQFKVISESVDDGFYGILGFTSEEGLMGNLYGGNFTLNLSGLYGSLDLNNAGSEWYIQKPYFDTEKSRVFFPQTGDTERRLAISVNNEFADENGNIEIDYISESEKGQPLGVATLDADGQIPTDQLPTKAMTIEGDWDASTNTPHLEDGVGNDGMVYVCQVPGTVDFGSGEYEFRLGDWAVYGANGKWFRSRNSNEVTSVNAMRGDVVLDASDVGALSSDDSRIANWDSAYAFANGLGVPYTGANKPIDFGNQDFLHNGRLVRGSFFVKSGVINLGSSINIGQTFYLNITDLSSGNKSFSAQVELASLRGYRLVKSLDLSMPSSSMTVRQSAYTYASQHSDVAIGEPERISDTEIRIPIIPLQNNVTGVAQVTILGRAGTYNNVKFSASTESVTSTAPQPAPMFALASEVSKIITFPTHAMILNGAFNEELFGVCPTFDPNFVSWDLTWQVGNEYLSLKQEYFTKTDTPLRLTTVGGCLAIKGDCFIQIDIPAGAKLVLNYA